MAHLKRPWCWERLRAGGEGDDRGWDGWVASPTWCTWVWVNSGSWWWTRRPGMLQSMGSQRVGHDWATELNWTEETERFFFSLFFSTLPYLRLPRFFSPLTGFFPTTILAIRASPAVNAGDKGYSDLLPGSERSLGGGYGNPLQYSSWENPMGRGARQGIVHSVAKSWT